MKSDNGYSHESEEPANTAGEFFEKLVWMTSEQAAAYLGVSVGSIRNFVCEGALPYSKWKGRLRFRRADIDRILMASMKGGWNAY